MRALVSLFVLILALCLAGQADATIAVSGTISVTIGATNGVSPDGTIINAPNGSLVNSMGTWTFGTLTNGPGQYQILLNGTASGWPAGQGYASLMEVAHGGVLYTFNSSANGWWTWTGTSWASSAAP